MATATYTTKSITNDFQKTKEKENRRTEGLSNRHRLASNSGSSGSVPKRYQSVFTEGTPLTSFGIRNDDNQRRSHSPTNHIQTQPHQRPLKPVKEFLTVQPIVDQQLEDRRRSSPQSNSHIRSQTDATLQSVNAALTKTLNKLRQDSSNNGTTNGHSTALRTGTASFRPMTSRSASHHTVNLITTSNFYYSVPGGTKGALPTELTTRRTSNGIPPPGRISNGNGPLAVQHHEMKSNDTPNTRAPTPYRVQPKSLDVDIHQTERINFNAAATTDNHPDRNRKLKYDSHQPLTTRTTSSRQSFSPRVPSADNQRRTLPEVSVNPHIQSSVQKNGEQVLQIHEPLSNGLSNDQIHLPMHDNHSKRRHHIQVEPTNTFKRTASPMKHQQIADVHPNLIVHHQRAILTPNSTANIVPTNPKNSLNEAYVVRDNPARQLLTPVNTHTNNENDSASTLKYYENQQENMKNLITPPPSPATQELNRIWKKHRNKYSTRSGTASLAARRTSRHHRPPGRLKHYDDESGTETTETQSKDEDMARRQCLPPSDLGSDAWSDLTSEFSDTKFRKHPNIRTSTPNMTRQSSRQSSSQSSKEVGQIRKQLTDLQIMYSDLLKLLDIDIESMRSSHKSSTSSQADHNSRKHRFRKIMPVTSMRQSNIDLREVNQRFQRLETSIVTLAESIAKLSAQLQMQRVIKDDVYQLRQEVAELRQLLHQQQPLRQQPTTTSVIPPTTTTSTQQPSRLLSPNIQRLATINSTNPLNVSTSYQPSASMAQRSNSIIDPRQARKIEQFFGIEAMLRYFLSLLNYEEYAPVLEREKIGIYELPYISERKLQSFGIPYGPCARIIHEAQQYFISLLTLKSSGIDV